MPCPESQRLEALLAGTLGAEEHLATEQHLASCGSCAKEAAWIAAMRTGLAGLGPAAGPGGPDCIDDETLSAFVDDALSSTRRTSVLAHLLRCEHCLQGLVTLERALVEADQQAQRPPQAALNRAIRIGAPGRSAVAPAQEKQAPLTWFERILGGGLAWRIGMASAAAGLVLLLAMVFGGDPTDRAAAPGLRPDGAKPQVARGPAPGEQAADQAPSDRVPDPAPRPPRPDGDRSSDRNAKKDVDSQPVPARLADLAERVIPQAGADRPLEGQALAEPAGGAARFGQAYLMGQRLAFLDRFQSHLAASPRIRKLVANTLLDLDRDLTSRSHSDAESGKLAAFARDLGTQLAAEEIQAAAAGRRLAVFIQALTDHLAGANEGPESKFGALVQGWRTAAASSGAPPDPAELERARQIIRQATLLDPSGRGAVLERLDRLAGPQAPADDRSARILDELNGIDQAVRLGR